MTAANVWCRSVNAGYTYRFCLVNTNGGATSYDADISWGVAPGFHNPERGTGQM